jgi:hypothetical protein
MFLINWFTASPLRAAIAIISTLVVTVVVFSMVMTVLAFSNGPGDCTPGGGPITVSDANADSFDQKWDDLDAILDSGSPSSITLNESEISSRADRFFTEENALDFRDVRVCIHDGYGEATGALDAILGLQVELKFKGTMGDIDEALDDIELKHTYTATLTEGEVRIDGVPRP